MFVAYIVDGSTRFTGTLIYHTAEGKVGIEATNGEIIEVAPEFVFVVH